MRSSAIAGAVMLPGSCRPGQAGQAALIGVYADSSRALFRRLFSRRGHFRRLDQTGRPLDLVRLDLNGEADVDEYAERITLGAPA